MLFGISHHRGELGSETLNTKGLLAQMIRAANSGSGDGDDIRPCFCEYLDHGRCGVIVEGYVHNDQTLQNISRQAVNAAAAGADVIAPSAMIDGQFAAIRQALDNTVRRHADNGLFQQVRLLLLRSVSRPAGCDLKATARPIRWTR